LNIQELFILISDLGHGPLYFLIALMVIAIGWRQFRTTSGQKHELLSLGWRLATFWITGVLLNTAFKYYFLSPRPWWVDPNLPPLHPHPAGGYGMPSGHTQSAIGIILFSIGLTQLLHKRGQIDKVMKTGVILLGVTWVTLIASSRIVLHAHSLKQVLMGAVLGSIWSLSLVYIQRSKKGPILLLNLTLVLTLVCLWQATHRVDTIPDQFVAQLTAYHVMPPSGPPLNLLMCFSTMSLFSVWSLKWLYTKRNSMP
jgi:membrane-associated phospholipid phosphatase